jgi:transcriptional regulator with XRE-family HTH domain
MDSITKCLATNIKNLRKLRNLTQTELADKAGISPIFLQGIESERKWISPSTVKSLAHALKVPEAKLFENCHEKEINKSFPQVTTPQRIPHIPEDVWSALLTTCKHPQWKWEVFRWILDGYKKQISRSPR